MDTSIFSDPAKIGPGIWFSIHIDAVNAVTDDRKVSFEIKINDLCDNFKCKKCQPHFRRFIEDHPFKNYWNIIDSLGRDIGFYKWTWECHNAVNKFLKKPELSLSETYDYFANPEVGACFNCGAAKNNLPPAPIIEQRSRAIPSIITLYRESDKVISKPFRLISKN